MLFSFFICHLKINSKLSYSKETTRISFSLLWKYNSFFEFLIGGQGITKINVYRRSFQQTVSDDDGYNNRNNKSMLLS